MRLVIIDGYNLICTDGDFSDCLAYEGVRAAREEMERVVLRWARIDGDVDALLLYDGRYFPGGHPGNRDEGPLRVRFVDPPAEADDRILYDAREAVKNGSRVVVVTDDRKLARGTEEFGTDHLSIRSFVSLLERSPREPFKESRFSDREIEDLEREQLERPMPEVKPSTQPVPSAQTPRIASSKNREERIESPACSEKDKSKRRERYKNRIKKRAASGKGKPPKRKKKRGY